MGTLVPRGLDQVHLNWMSLLAVVSQLEVKRIAEQSCKQLVLVKEKTGLASQRQQAGRLFFRFSVQIHISHDSECRLKITFFRLFLTSATVQYYFIDLTFIVFFQNVMQGGKKWHRCSRLTPTTTFHLLQLSSATHKVFVLLWSYTVF